MAEELYFHGNRTRPACAKRGATVKKELYFLSNFYPCKFKLDGKQWPSSEHYYQAAKFPVDHPIHEEIRQARTAGAAKARAYGRDTPGLLRKDWDTARLDVMRRALRAKFSKHGPLCAKLLATGTAVLHEDAPKDPFWGVCGQDQLGKMLMAVREELNAETKKMFTADSQR